MEETPFNILEPDKAFILKFKRLPVLWDTFNPHYSNKYKRNEALTKLLPYLKKIRPHASTDDVRKKINSLRSNYRRELRKIIMSQSDDSDAVYTPKGYTFKLLSFLGTLEGSEPAPKLMKHETSDTGQDDETSDSESEEMTIEQSDQIKPDMLFSITPPPTNSDIKKRANRSTQHYHYEHIPQTSNPLVLEWVNTLDRLDPLQRLYAKKAINDILFEAELGNLTRYSVKINEPNDPIQSPPCHPSSLID